MDQRIVLFLSLLICTNKETGLKQMKCVVGIDARVYLVDCFEDRKNSKGLYPASSV